MKSKGAKNLLWVPPLRSGRQVRRIITAALFVLCLSGVAFAHSATNRFWGEVPVDMTLSGDVLVVKTLTVPEGVKLTIEPGTVVRFEPSENNGIVISGELSAVGTKDKPIRFVSKDGKGFWRGIEFTGGGKGRVEKCIIERAQKGIIDPGQKAVLKDVKYK